MLSASPRSGPACIAHRGTLAAATAALLLLAFAPAAAAAGVASSAPGATVPARVSMSDGPAPLPPGPGTPMPPGAGPGPQMPLAPPVLVPPSGAATPPSGVATAPAAAEPTPVNEAPGTTPANAATPSARSEVPQAPVATTDPGAASSSGRSYALPALFLFVVLLPIAFVLLTRRGLVSKLFARRYEDEETASSTGDTEIFVNSARRGQILVGRQLMLLERLRSATDTAAALDHVAAATSLAEQMRRNTEIVLLLSGVEPSSRLSAAGRLSDVVRGSLTGMEDYERVELNFENDPILEAHFVLPVAHLVAELLENAAHFSDLGSRIVVAARASDVAIELTVTDHGLGMSDGDLAIARQRLVELPAQDPAPHGVGLFLVGLLARRMGVDVNLSTIAGAGTTATVRLPSSVFADFPVITADLVHAEVIEAEPVAAVEVRPDVVEAELVTASIASADLVTADQTKTERIVAQMATRPEEKAVYENAVRDEDVRQAQVDDASWTQHVGYDAIAPAPREETDEAAGPYGYVDSTEAVTDVPEGESTEAPAARTVKSHRAPREGLYRRMFQRRQSNVPSRELVDGERRSRRGRRLSEAETEIAQVIVEDLTPRDEVSELPSDVPIESAMQGVVADPAMQVVVADPAEDVVVAGPAEAVVAAGPAEDVAAGPAEDVAAGPAEDVVATYASVGAEPAGGRAAAAAAFAELLAGAEAQPQHEPQPQPGSAPVREFDAESLQELPVPTSREAEPEPDRAFASGGIDVLPQRGGVRARLVRRTT